MTTCPASRTSSREQVELLARELQLLAVEARAAGAGVDPRARRSSTGSPAAVAAARAVRRSTARMRAITSGAAERLDDVVVGAELEPDDAVGLGAARGQHHDRHVAVAAQLAAHVAPVAVGQRQVEQHEVGLELARAARAPPRPVRAVVGSKPARASACENGSAIDGSSSTNRMVGPFAAMIQSR